MLYVGLSRVTRRLVIILDLPLQAAAGEKGPLKDARFWWIKVELEEVKSAQAEVDRAKRNGQGTLMYLTPTYKHLDRADFPSCRLIPRRVDA